MTNAQIIFNESIELMENGIIGNTGRKIIIENEDGEKKEMLEPESIHTYAGWKAIGRQVKKGEKSIATILIWKHTTKKAKDKDEEEQENMFMTKAFFFKECQTEAIAQ
jgi:antirestriction protein ArdC